MPKETIRFKSEMELETSKETKPKYTPPEIVNLGELAKGQGASCVDGSSATGPQCNFGGLNNGSGCTMGFNA